MDPKALSHLDPKARETYDRVMGTASAVESATQQPTTPLEPTTAPDSGFVPLTSTDPSASLSTPTPVPNDPGFTSGPADLSMAGMNPDPAPTTPPATDITAVPSLFSANPVSPDAQNASSSFFTNPSPSSTEPTPSADGFASVQPLNTAADTILSTDTPAAPTPITPYTPTGLNDPLQPPPVIDQADAQPLQSPATAQPAPHQNSALLRVLYIVAAVVFFAIYTIFWIKVFNLPFLF